MFVVDRSALFAALRDAADRLNMAIQKCMSPVGRAPSLHHASHGDGLDWQQRHSTMESRSDAEPGHIGSQNGI